jgi:hypothetical protein
MCATNAYCIGNRREIVEQTPDDNPDYNLRKPGF